MRPASSHRPRRITRLWSMTAALTLALIGVAQAEEDRFAGVEIEPYKVAGNIYMLTGSGGNMGLSVGPDGTFLIDDQFLPLADRIRAAIESVGGSEPRLLLNTHFHGDHAGGNPAFGATATILAHRNARARLEADEAFPRVGLPVVTYADGIRLHLNGDTIEVIHMPAGHTDGDSVVWFRESGVIHTGDLVFNRRFPYIDQSSGGSVSGVIANQEALIALLPHDIKVIPGHGPLASRTDLEANLNMIRSTRAMVVSALGEGRSLDQIIAEGLGEQWDGWAWEFIDEARWIRILAADVSS